MIPEGYKLIRLRHPDGSDSLVMIEDEFYKRVAALEDPTITLPEEVAT